MQIPVAQVDITNFQSEVIDLSESTTVLVEFWSPTVPQCATLSEQLHKLTLESGGSWVLRRMNVADPQNQQLAMQLHLQGVPAVKVFQDGKLIDEFSGLPPLPQLEEWLQRFGADDTVALVNAARQALEDCEYERASQMFKALQEIDAADVRPLLGFAEIAISMDDEAAAVSILEQIPEDKINDDLQGWYSKIELLISGFGKDKSVFEKAIEADPNDYEARYELAMLNATTEDYDDAFEHLIFIVAMNPRSGDDKPKKEGAPVPIEEKARLSAIKLFEVVGPATELAIEWRKKLGRAMY